MAYGFDEKRKTKVENLAKANKDLTTYTRAYEEYKNEISRADRASEAVRKTGNERRKSYVDFVSKFRSPNEKLEDLLPKYVTTIDDLYALSNTNSALYEQIVKNYDKYVEHRNTEIASAPVSNTRPKEEDYLKISELVTTRKADIANTIDEETIRAQFTNIINKLNAEATVKPTLKDINDIENREDFYKEIGKLENCTKETYDGLTIKSSEIEIQDFINWRKDEWEYKNSEKTFTADLNTILQNLNNPQVQGEVLLPKDKATLDKMTSAEYEKKKEAIKERVENADLDETVRHDIKVYLHKTHEQKKANETSEIIENAINQLITASNEKEKKENPKIYKPIPASLKEVEKSFSNYNKNKENDNGYSYVSLLTKINLLIKEDIEKNPDSVFKKNNINNLNDFFKLDIDKHREFEQEVVKTDIKRLINAKNEVIDGPKITETFTKIKALSKRSETWDKVTDIIEKENEKENSLFKENNINNLDDYFAYKNSIMTDTEKDTVYAHDKIKALIREENKKHLNPESHWYNFKPKYLSDYTPIPETFKELTALKNSKDPEEVKAYNEAAKKINFLVSRNTDLYIKGIKSVEDYYTLIDPKNVENRKNDAEANRKKFDTMEKALISAMEARNEEKKGKKHYVPLPTSAKEIENLHKDHHQYKYSIDEINKLIDANKDRPLLKLHNITNVQNYLDIDEKTEEIKKDKEIIVDRGDKIKDIFSDVMQGKIKQKAEKTDAEKTDAEKVDTEKADTEKADTEKTKEESKIKLPKDVDKLLKLEGEEYDDSLLQLRETIRNSSKSEEEKKRLIDFTDFLDERKYFLKNGNEISSDITSLMTAHNNNYEIPKFDKLLNLNNADEKDREQFNKYAGILQGEISSNQLLHDAAIHNLESAQGVIDRANQRKDNAAEAKPLKDLRADYVKQSKRFTEWATKQNAVIERKNTKTTKKNNEKTEITNNFPGYVQGRISDYSKKLSAEADTASSDATKENIKTSAIRFFSFGFEKLSHGISNVEEAIQLGLVRGEVEEKRSDLEKINKRLNMYDNVVAAVKEEAAKAKENLNETTLNERLIAKLMEVGLKEEEANKLLDDYPRLEDKREELNTQLKALEAALPEKEAEITAARLLRESKQLGNIGDDDIARAKVQISQSAAEANGTSLNNDIMLQNYLANSAIYKNQVDTKDLNQKLQESADSIDKWGNRLSSILRGNVLEKVDFVLSGVQEVYNLYNKVSEAVSGDGEEKEELNVAESLNTFRKDLSEEKDEELVAIKINNIIKDIGEKMEVIATKLSDMKQDHMLANSANKLNKNILKERSDEFKAKLDDFKNANNEKRNDLSKIVPAEIDIFKNDNDKIPTKNMPVFFKNCIDEINNNERLTLDNITREKNISIQNRDQAKTFKDEKQVAVDNAQKEFDNLVQEERKFYQNQIDYNKNTAEHKSTVISAKDITNTKVNGIGMISKISGVELNANSTPENLKKAFDKIYINGLSANEFFDIKETENLKEQYENAGNKLKQYFASLQNGDEKKNELDGCSISVENDKGMLDTVKMEIVPGELPQKPVEPSAWKFWEKKDYEKQLADYNENITKYNRRLEALSDFNESADIVTNSMNSTRVEFAKLKLDSINKEVAEKTAKKPEKTTGEQEKTTEEAEKTPEEIKKEVHKMKLEEIISKSRGEKTLQQKTKPVAEKEENTAEKDKDNNKEIQSPAKK